MTIHTYYYTFGFLVPINECIKLLGYTIENLTAEKRKEIIDECGFDEGDFTDEQLCHSWFEYECRETYASEYSFEIAGNKYIVRSFCHDNPDSEKYLVVGVPIGEMDRFEGKYTSRIPPEKLDVKAKKLIIPLAQNPDWQKVIQKSEDNTTLYRRADYAVPDLEYESFSICPSIYTTTDDCDCCS